MNTHLMSRACALAIAALAAPAFAADSHLFQAAPMTPLVNDAAFVEIAKEPSTASATIVVANAAAIGIDTDKIVLDLDIGGAFRLTAQRIQSYRSDDGSIVWQGSLPETRDLTGGRPAANEVDGDPLNSVTLVRDGNYVTGNIRVHGQLYAVRPLFDGRHAIVEVDEAKMPADHDEVAYRRLFDEAGRAALAPSKAIEANSVVRVLVNYTSAANNATPSMSGLINLAISESNQGYANSSVAVTLQLAGSGLVSYTETGNFSTELSRYRSTSDGYMDTIHTQRNNVAADVAVLIVNGSAYCGIGYMNVNAASAFTVVARTCATGYYSFAHEIGHNFGANHDPANASGSPYAYGHGYQYPAGRWRTIMAYACAGVSCTRINYWSNPNKTYNGVAMGTAATHNNARVLNQRAATVAAFR
ncbi:M12 family metallo-peptidase [Tahibacter sp.]|uniref:M12 family metallo-peptidase n=1 Tax=Tahibacter sp. TaxID=2056211 RepID=UPI0028C48BEF|nr:M12 family metallo-peptidase [Tahibacter sp.]